ncbi:hypothetical protein Tco_1087963 [Tanacetum coccineum]
MKTISKQCWLLEGSFDGVTQRTSSDQTWAHRYFPYSEMNTKRLSFKGYGPKDSEQESNAVCDKKSDNSKEKYEESLDRRNKYTRHKINCDNHQRRGIVSRNNYSRVDAKTTHPSVYRNMSPKVVLLKTGLTPLNTVRPIYTAHPKPAVYSAKSKSHFSKQAQSTAQRPFYKQTALTRRSVHTAKRHYYNGRPRAVNIARPTKPNGASLAFKRHNYIDARGRSKSIMAWVRTPRYISLVVPLKKVGDEVVHKDLGDRMERATTTASSLEVEHDSGSGPKCQDTILGDVDAQTRFEITCKQSNDPPLLRGYILGSGEDSMKQLELMELCIQLSYKNKKSVLVSQKK